MEYMFQCFAWDAKTFEPLCDAKEYKDEEKIIFIGNSYTFYGNAVVNAGQNTDDASMQIRFGADGYFNQLLKQNNIDMQVTNWTWGGHGVDDIFDGSCAADRGHDGHDHLADLKRLSAMNYDYVVIQPTYKTATNGEELKEQIQMVKDAFGEKSPDAQYILLMPSGYYVNDTTGRQNFRKELPGVIEETDILVANWGILVSDIIKGKAVVENSTQSYSKNSFIVSNSAEDGYHPNQLAGYITAQTVFSVITGKKAAGENYAFCTDGSINLAFDVNDFLSSFYVYDNISEEGNLKGDELTNYPEIFNSPDDMLGIQKLIDKYIEEKPYMNVE